MCRIMGVSNRVALQKAEALGIAMQLTNIARDINEDWHNGRRYVPRKWLSVTPKKDMNPTSKQLRQAVGHLLNLADHYYRIGYQGLEHLPDAARIAIRLAGNVYQEIGNEIRRNDFALLSSRAFVPLSKKLRIAARCLASEINFRTSRFTQNVYTHGLDTFVPTSFLSNGDMSMNNETRYLGYLGLSLTFVMATTLFFLMGLNPKESSYEMLPWFYTVGCATLAAVTGLVARSYNRELKPVPVEKSKNP